MVIDEEREANKIVQEAKAQAEKIKNEAQEEAEEIHRKTYDKIVAEAKRRFAELKKQAKESAEREAEIFLRQAEDQINEIQTKAKKKFGGAVNATLDKILS